MRRALPALLAAALIGFAPAALAETTTYSNARYGTTVSFPADIFSTALEPPDNGDGQTFVARDGASLSIFASANPDASTPRQLLDEAASNAGADVRITYRKHGRNWAVLSGFKGGDIFYQRFELGTEDVVHSVLITYPAALKAEYDPLVGRIASSLTGP
ncbi:MAG: hypothetical protein WBA44_08125 [Mesorhizobium sp.]